MSDAVLTNKGIWNNIYKQGASNLAYPNENLVRYIHYLKSKDALKNGAKVLDYGFGSGNNLHFLLDVGFDVYGIEISSEAKKLSLQRLPQTFDPERLVVIDANKGKQFPSNFFDLVVAWQVLYYNTDDSFRKALKDIYDLMSEEAIFLGTMARISDISYQKSLPIGDNRYNRKADTTSIRGQGNAVFVFYGEEELHDIFSIFRDLEIGFFESSFQGVTSSHWVICGKK